MQIFPDQRINPTSNPDDGVSGGGLCDVDVDGDDGDDVGSVHDGDGGGASVSMGHASHRPTNLMLIPILLTLIAAILRQVAVIPSLQHENVSEELDN
uniref:Uncharacterized protein n=1 Tax=Setaria digitata TaxID=48799 RepID=A0A915Q891_9BILA